MEGVRLLRMVHYGFKDLQICFDLEIFANLSRLKVNTKTSLPQSIINFSLYSTFYFPSVFCFYFSLCVDQTAPHHTLLLLCVTQISWPGAPASTSLVKISLLLMGWFSVGKKGPKDMQYWVFQHRQLGHDIQEGRSTWLQETPWSNPCLFIL